ncbi:MAG: HAD-IA family hydrolase [Verrucomicrobiota bacterium]
MRPVKHVRAVSFDVGGTLIGTSTAVGEIYATVAADFGLKDLDAEWLDRQFLEVWKHKVDFDYSRANWFELVRRTFGARSADLPGEFFPAVFHRFGEPDVWRIHPDVLPVLDELAGKGIPMAVVSNWDDRLRPLLKRLGLAGYFETIIPSSEVAFHKPSPVVFEEVVRKLRIPPEQILHIGDHYIEDVEGARGAGLQAVQLVRNGKGAAEYHISGLWEVPPLVDSSGDRLIEMRSL